MIKGIKKTYDSYKNSMINKVNKFQQSVIKNNKFNDSYELNNLIIHTQLLIKTFEEINKELTWFEKNWKEFRIDFDEDVNKYFDELNYNYFKKEGCTADDGGLFYFKTQEEMNGLDCLIRNITNGKELKFMPKRMKSKLPIYRIGFLLIN